MDTKLKAGYGNPAARMRRLINGYQTARALMEADELGLVKILNEGPLSLSALAERTGLEAGVLDRFLRLLVLAEVLEENEDGTFANGPLSGELRLAARGVLEGYEAWSDIQFSLRTAGSAFEKRFGKHFYDHLAGNPGRVKRWDDSMVAVSEEWLPGVLQAYDFGQTSTLADLAGGRGTFISKVLQRYPEMQGILFDRAPVIGQAQPLLEAAGVAERCRTIAGDFTESVPPGADTYSICNALVDWSDHNVSRIFRNCRQAMPDGARLLVIDRLFPAADHPQYEEMVNLDLFFLVLFGGAVRKESVFSQLLTDAGFKVEGVYGIGGCFALIESFAIS